MVTMETYSGNYGYYSDCYGHGNIGISNHGNINDWPLSQTCMTVTIVTIVRTKCSHGNLYDGCHSNYFKPMI